MIDFAAAPALFDASDLASMAPGLSDDAVAAAVSALRRECGWHIAPVWTQTVEFDISDRHSYGQWEKPYTLLLPTQHLVSVTSVTDTKTGLPLTDWTVSRRGGFIQRRAPWPAGLEAVEVVFTHGLSAAPLELGPVVADLAVQAGTALAGAGQLTVMGPFQFGAHSTVFEESAECVVNRYRLPVVG